MGYKRVFEDHFDKDKIDPTKWMSGLFDRDARGDTMEWSQWATNVRGIDEKGNVNGKNPVGGRHAMYYNHKDEEHAAKAHRIGPEGLIMGGYVLNQRDLTKKDSHHPYFDKRAQVEVDFRNQMLYGPWLQTAGVTKLDGVMAPLPESPQLFWQYGKFKMRVDFSGMKTPSYRFSWWWMAMYDFVRKQVLNGTNYDSDAANGLEVDGFEFVFLPSGKQYMLMKCIGANASNVPPIDVQLLGIDLRDGPVDVEVEWTPKAIIWRINDIEVAREPNAIPHCGMQMLMTREANSGVRNNDEWRPRADKPYLQYDPGLFGHNVGAYLSNVRDDQAVIRHVIIEQDDAIKGTARSRLALDDTREVEPLEKKKKVDVFIPTPTPAPEVLPRTPKDQEDDPALEGVCVKGRQYVVDEATLGRKFAEALNLEQA